MTTSHYKEAVAKSAATSLKQVVTEKFKHSIQLILTLLANTVAY